MRAVKRDTRGKIDQQIRAEDLDFELVGREVELVLHNGATLRGKLIESSRYWLKIEINGKWIYINKSYLIYIRPV